VPTPPPAPGSACSDNVDNDGDKRIDYPEDKGCDSPDDPYEQGRKHTRRLLRKQGTVLPPATMAPLGACWDGVDNDDDRRADYPKDKGCDSPDDPYELNRPQTKRLLEGLE
jgi:rRNA maturation protein Nop10